MADQSQGSIEAGKEAELQTGTLYSVSGLNFVVRQALLKGKEKVVPLPRDRKVLQNSSVLSALLLMLSMMEIKGSCTSWKRWWYTWNSC